MTTETTNTSKFKLIPQGEYIFSVDGIPQKREVTGGKGSFRLWSLKYFNLEQGKETINSVIFFGNSPSYHDILLAVGGVEVSPDEVKWDDESVHGRKFSATITHEKNEKNGRVQEVFSDVKAVTEKDWE